MKTFILNKNMKTEKLFFIVPIIMYIIGLILYTNYNVTISESKAKKEIDQKLIQATYSTIISLDNKILNNINEQKKNDIMLQNLKLSVTSRALQLRNIYVLLKNNGKIVFAVIGNSTIENTDDTINLFLKEYSEITNLYDDIIISQEKYFYDGMDRWGNFRALLTPKVTNEGTDYVIVTSIDTNQIDELLHNVTYKSIINGIIFFILSIPIIIGFTMSTRRVNIMLQEKLISSKNKIKEISKDLESYIKTMNENIFTISLDNNKNIIDISRAFMRFSGYYKEDLKSKSIYEILAKKQDKEILDNVFQNSDSNLRFQDEIKLIKSLGEKYWSLFTVIVNFNFKNEKIGYTIIINDITDKKKIETLATQDPLTGIYNRNKMEMIFELEIDRFNRYNSKFSVLMLDIDHFKPINDTYGHQTGDNVLIEFTTIINKAIRANDYLCRYGGEEFIIILGHIDIEGAKLTAEKIRKKIESHIFSGVPKPITVSIGVGEFKKGESSKDIIKRIDERLYYAKENGRNMVSVAE